VVGALAFACGEVASSDETLDADASVGEPTSAGDQGDTGPGESTATTSANGASGDDASGSGTDTPATTSTDGAPDTGSADTGGDSWFCNELWTDLVDVDMQIAVNRVAGDDVLAEWDPAQGSHACVQVLEDRVGISVEVGPFDGGTALGRIYLEVLDGIRVYDISVDAEPFDELGGFGALQLSYSYDVEGPPTLVFNTGNSGGVGMVDVVALPIDGGANVEFTAVGAIPSKGGWEFDLSFRAVTVSP
jgi:hypothetical protein